MNMRYPLITLILLSPTLHAATSLINYSFGELRGDDGSVIPDGGGLWAIIVDGQPGEAPSTPPSGADNVLPGGLIAGTSLTILNGVEIFNDFSGAQIAAGQSIDGDYIAAVGPIDGSNESGIAGVLFSSYSMEVYETAGDLGLTPGTEWGLYWFPGLDMGNNVATGAFSVGGFLEIAPNPASGGDVGMVVPPGGSTQAINYYETNFNQTVISGPDTGLDEARFTAVLIPEPSAGLLSLFGLALFRRRR